MSTHTHVFHYTIHEKSSERATRPVRDEFKGLLETAGFEVRSDGVFHRDVRDLPETTVRLDVAVDDKAEAATYAVSLFRELWREADRKHPNLGRLAFVAVQGPILQVQEGRSSGFRRLAVDTVAQGVRRALEKHAATRDADPGRKGSGS